MASLSRVASLAAPRCRVITRRQLSALSSPSEEFAGLPSVTPTASEASSASVTTLSNGLTIVTETASSTSTVSLTFPNAGSSSETVSEKGAALANKCMAFKSGSGISSAVILRTLENDGATPFASVNRHSATVGFTACPEKAEHLLPLLATTCSYEKWDMKDAITTAKIDVAEAKSNAQTVLTESIFAGAYGAQSALGSPLYAEGASFPTIASFRDRTYVLNGAVLSATGVADHEAFVKSVEEGLSESAVGSPVAPTTHAYMGGEVRVHAPSSGYTHVALAFNGPSSSVMQSVLKQCLTLQGASAFTAPGIVGVYGGAESAAAGSVVDGLCDIASTKVSADVVERAKALAKAEALFALDADSRTLAEHMTSTVMESGTYSAAAIAASYDAITPADVEAALSAAMASKPVLASVGDTSSIPYLASIASRFS